MNWYLTKVTTPSGVATIYALGDNIKQGTFDWGKVERLRILQPNEVDEIHKAEDEICRDWASKLPDQ